MTGKRSTQLVGTGVGGRVERRSPSAKANLTSHFHSTCSWQPASPRLQRRQRRKRLSAVGNLDFEEKRGREKKRRKGFVEANEGERSQGQQPRRLTSRVRKIFQRLERNENARLLNLRNHLWGVCIYTRFRPRLMDLAGRLADRKKRRAPSDTNCRGI